MGQIFYGGATAALRRLRRSVGEDGRPVVQRTHRSGRIAAIAATVRGAVA